MSEGRGRQIVSTPKEIIEVLEKRYPNDAIKVDELKTEKERNEYTAKLKLIREIKVLTGQE